MASKVCLLVISCFVCVYSMTDQEVHQRFNSLFKEIADLKKKVSFASSFCKTIAGNVCGPCTCLDDWRNEKGYYCDCREVPPKRDCLEFYQNGMKWNGLYIITMNSWFQGKKTSVYCDQTTDGGGWTVFQRRVDGSVNFYRDWHDYKQGFGDIRHEFWLGNEKLHDLIYQGHIKGNELRIDLKNFDRRWAYAKYGTFRIGDESSKYQLYVSSYSGNASDNLYYNNGMKFSTYDQDNDAYSSHCAQYTVGPWWHKSCTNTYLNGYYADYKGSYRGTGIYWSGFSSGTFSRLKWTEMKVRRKI